MPPTAAITGNASFLGSRSSPTVISRLISSPTTRKNSVIRPSLTQCCRSCSIERLPMSMVATVPQSRSYEAANGEFTHTKATNAAARSRMLDASSVLRNSRSREVRVRIISLCADQASRRTSRLRVSA
jgi:hypothetical protein